MLQATMEIKMSLELIAILIEGMREEEY